MSLFDGKSLEGWDGDPTKWRVADGAITGEISAYDEPSFLICRDLTAGDFELKAEYRLRYGSGGIQYRSERDSRHRLGDARVSRRYGCE